MLVEALLHLTAETSPELRRIGLVGDAVALWSRSTRRRTGWAAHEARCHDVVLSAMAGLRHRRSVVVLGSGLVRDVPLGHLTRSFERIVLVDAVHLWPARHRSRHPKVERRILDLTGWAERTTQDGVADTDSLAALKADPTIDLVISANVLSQLPLAAEAWCERHGKPAHRVGAELIARHLADLAGFGGRVCLLTDVAYRDIDRSGASGPEHDILHGSVLPPEDDSWDWTVAPRGELDRNFARVHRVHGWSDFRVACVGDSAGASR